MSLQKRSNTPISARVSPGIVGTCAGARVPGSRHRPATKPRLLLLFPRRPAPYGPGCLLARPSPIVWYCFKYHMFSAGMLPRRGAGRGPEGGA